jgi:hypothetical protein
MQLTLVNNAGSFSFYNQLSCASIGIGKVITDIWCGQNLKVLWLKEYCETGFMQDQERDSFDSVCIVSYSFRCYHTVWLMCFAVDS